MFIQICVCPQGGCAIPACIAGGIKACLAVFQAHTQRGSLGGSVQGVPAPGGVSAPVGACSGGGVAFCYGLLLWSSVMAFWFGGLLWPSGMVFGGPYLSTRRP